ncbi:hypothetical protein RISK_006153 [Rhodopirellula islandica]|uniref:Uncharacterized protein n=1 Tax=Rhodopirellula islandica TaxID=595434 RepID=A0A0J1E903_RHOIS|nr:hypothetical protein RISK_006153 [Rhodopirellula islandica]
MSNQDPTRSPVLLTPRDGNNGTFLQQHFHRMLLPFGTKNNAKGTSIN